MSDQAREDIEEFTQLLRESEEKTFSDLRKDLTKAGYDVGKLILAFFLGTDDCEEDGALVTPDERVLLFVRAPVPQKQREMRFIVFRDITEEPAAINRARTHIETGLKMAREASRRGNVA